MQTSARCFVVSVLCLSLTLSVPSNAFAALAGLTPDSVLPPRFSPEEEAHKTTSVQVTLSGQGDIYYTTDGSKPTPSSSKYSGPITVQGDKVVKAIAVQNGVQSGVASHAYYAHGIRTSQKLNLPIFNMPQLPPIAPSVVTSDGRMWLLGHTDVTVSFDASRNLLTSNRKNVWIINYPLEKIQGLSGSAAQRAQQLFGTNTPVKNWYFFEPGSGSYTIETPQYPPRFDLTPNPTKVVSPGQSIQAAVNAASCGDVIHVQPGVYAEGVIINKNCTEANPFILEGIRQGNVMPQIRKPGQDNDAVQLEGRFNYLRGFDIKADDNTSQRGPVRIRAGGNRVEYCYFPQTIMHAINLIHTDNDSDDIPSIVRGNWIIKPGHVGIGTHHDSWRDNRAPINSSNNANQDFGTPHRGPYVVEHNYVLDNNSSGHSSTWESGGAKFLHVTHIVYRYNIVEGGNGPGIWYDWENWSLIIDGNYFTNVSHWGVGYEASPGPVFISNNVITGLRRGGGPFYHGIMDWGSTQSIVFNNTIDQKGKDTTGIAFGVPRTENTRWGTFTTKLAWAYNNAIINAARGIDAGQAQLTQSNNEVGGNYSFNNPAVDDYSLKPGSSLINKGVVNAYTAWIPYDHTGLLRFDEDGKRSVGAYRNPVDIPSSVRNVIEIEFENSVKKRYLLDGTGASNTTGATTNTTGTQTTTTNTTNTTGTTGTQGACHLFNNSSAIPSGFAVPFDVFSSAHSLLMKVTCQSNQATFELGTGSATQYHYNQAYVWNGSSWQVVTLSGAQPVQAWLVGLASGTIPLPSGADPRFVVGYTCTYLTSQWKCGCRDQVCATPMWQLQAYSR